MLLPCQWPFDPRPVEPRKAKRDVLGEGDVLDLRGHLRDLYAGDPASGREGDGDTIFQPYGRRIHSTIPPHQKNKVSNPRRGDCLVRRLSGPSGVGSSHHSAPTSSRSRLRTRRSGHEGPFTSLCTAPGSGQGPTINLYWTIRQVHGTPGE